MFYKTGDERVIGAVEEDCNRPYGGKGERSRRRYPNDQAQEKLVSGTDQSQLDACAI